jgi:hypothetical protein
MVAALSAPTTPTHPPSPVIQDPEPNLGLVPVQDRAPTPSPAPPADPAVSARTGTGRLRDLIQPPADPIPDSLLEDLPEEARKVLSERKGTKPLAADEHHEGLVESMRRQGYVVTEDSKGTRLSGHLSPRFHETSEIPPSDVVRLAAASEGGVLPPEKRVRCPKCDAVIPAGSARCQWCGTPLTPQAGKP